MICTFRDTTDVTWWRELNLPATRPIIGHDGRFHADAPNDVDPDAVLEGRRAHLEAGAEGWRPNSSSRRAS